MGLNVPALGRGYRPQAPSIQVKHLSPSAGTAGAEADLFIAGQNAQQSREFGQAGAQLSAVGDELGNIAARRLRQEEYLFSNKVDVAFDKAATDHFLAFGQQVTGENTDQQLADLEGKLSQVKSDLLSTAPTPLAQQYVGSQLDKSINQTMTRAKFQAWKTRQEYGLDLSGQKDQTSQSKAQRARTPDELQAALGEIDKNWAGAAATGLVTPSVAALKSTESKQNALELNVTSQLTDPATRPWMVKAWDAGDFEGKFDKERLTRLSHQVTAAKHGMTIDEERAQRNAAAELGAQQDQNFYTFYSKLGTGEFGQADVSTAVDRGAIRPEQGRTLLDKITGAERKFIPDKNVQLDIMKKHADGELTDQDVIAAFADGRIDEAEAKSWMEKTRRVDSSQAKDAKGKLKSLIITTRPSDMRHEQQLTDYNTATTEVDQAIADGMKPREAALEVAKKYALRVPVDDATLGYYGGIPPESVDDVVAAQVKMVNDFRAGTIDRTTMASLATSFKDAQQGILDRDKKLRALRDMFGVDETGKARKSQGGQ